MKSKLTIIAVAAVVGVGVGAVATHVLSDKFSSIRETQAKPVVAAGESSLVDHLVQSQAVQMQDVQETVALNGKLAVDSLRVQQISARTAGRVDRMAIVEGGDVQVGQPLAWVYSPEFVSAQNEFLLARRTLKTLSNDATKDLLDDAKATLESARNKLRILGASAQDVAQLESRGLAQEYLVITSSLNGRLIKRNVDTGSYLNVGDSIGTAADLSSLWFFGNVFEADLPRLKIGQTVDIQVSGAKSDRYQGRISFISPTFDPQTHAVSVRVDLPNPRGELRPEMFARAQVAVGMRKLPVVPRAAIVQDGAQLFVIVQRADGRYERALVTTLETEDSQQVAIASGVQAGDRVVVEGGVLVDRSLVNATPASAAGAEKP